jgi:hypothetical protein
MEGFKRVIQLEVMGVQSKAFNNCSFCLQAKRVFFQDVPLIPNATIRNDLSITIQLVIF